MYNLNQFVMIKKHLLGGALLVSVLVLLTGCKEMMSSLDNPVSAYFEVTPTQATIAKNQTCQISYSTISDGKVTFKSSAENIATVDANGLVTAKTAGTAIITVELAATPYYQGATKNVEISVDAVLSIDATEVTVGYGASINLVKDYHLARKGDATINYEIIEGSEFITLDETTKDITGKVCGDAKVKVSVPASATASSDELVIDVKARVQNLAQLTAVIGSGKEPFAYLADGVSITLPDAGIDLSGKKVTIKGDEKKPATVKVKNEIIISDDFVLENVVVDASESTKPFISLAATPTTTAVNDCYFIDNVIIKNTAIKDMQSYFIYSSSQTRYVVKNMMIDGCVVKLKTILDGTSQLAALIRLNNNQSGVKDFTVQNSTFYQTGVSNPQYFVQYSQGDPGRWKLADAETWSFNYYNNTFYGVTTGNWANTSRTNNVKGRTIFNLKKNIWVDCGNGQTVQRILNQQQASGFKEANFEYNTYWKDGAAVDQSSYDKSGKILTTDPKFKDAANGDFTPQGDKQVENKTGDPRWLK